LDWTCEPEKPFCLVAAIFDLRQSAEEKDWGNFKEYPLSAPKSSSARRFFAQMACFLDAAALKFWMDFRFVFFLIFYETVEKLN
jgi:hypothetical protein